MTELDEDDFSKLVKSISLISPENYFQNLQFMNEYIWIQNQTLQELVKIIAEQTIIYNETDI